MQSLF